MRLERHIVVRAALELLNEVGLEGLTTRRLAEKLGVQGPALYWHFRNKQELIDEMALALLQDSFGRMQPGDDWAVWLTQGARRLREALLSCRDGARIISGFRPRNPHGRMDPSAAFGPMLEAGFVMPDALWAVRTVALFAIGWTLDEQTAVDRNPPMDLPFDPAGGFEYGLCAIIAGLKAKLEQQKVQAALSLG